MYLWYACRPDLRPLVAAVAIAGLVVGASPVLVSSIASPGSGTLAAVVQIFHHGGTRSAVGHPSIVSGIVGTFAVSVPLMTGGNGICGLTPAEAWPLSAGAPPHVIGCTLVHAGWGSALLALLVLGVVSTIQSLRNVTRRPDTSQSAEVTGLERRRLLARLVVLAGAGLTLVGFMISPAPAPAPWYDVRYLTGLWIAIPILVAPLLTTTGRWSQGTVSIAHAVRGAALALVLTALFLDTAATFAATTVDQFRSQEQQVLLSTLLHHDVHHIYSDYWTCDRLAFLSREQIVCAALDDRLQPSLDRYLPYRAIVERDHTASYVFTIGSDQAQVFAHRAAHNVHYRRLLAAGYVIFRWSGNLR